MEDEMIALCELIQELGEKYDAYISAFSLNGKGTNVRCESKINGNVDKYMSGGKE